MHAGEHVHVWNVVCQETSKTHYNYILRIYNVQFVVTHMPDFQERKIDMHQWIVTHMVGCGLYAHM